MQIRLDHIRDQLPHNAPTLLAFGLLVLLMRLLADCRNDAVGNDQFFLTIPFPFLDLLVAQLPRDAEHRLHIERFENDDAL
ncbi:MAG: hypothetical protein MI741_18450, partial [Rhodospirillales bacterium]|nr:hypothetical protein [Rhodospirillales bacterium]